MSSRASQILRGAAFGAIPGAVLLVLTIPVSGEAELTLGVAGIFVGAVGIVIGAASGAQRSRRGARGE